MAALCLADVLRSILGSNVGEKDCFLTRVRWIAATIFFFADFLTDFFHKFLDRRVSGKVEEYKMNLFIDRFIGSFKNII